MKTKIEVKLKSFSIPNFVLIDDDHKTTTGEDRTLPLSMIDSLTLEKMCEEFTNSVFRKAKKKQTSARGLIGNYGPIHINKL